MIVLSPWQHLFTMNCMVMGASPSHPVSTVGSTRRPPRKRLLLFRRASGAPDAAHWGPTPGVPSGERHSRRAPDRAVPSALLRRHGDSAPVGVTQPLAALASLYHQSHETRQGSRVRTSWARPRSPGTMSPRSPVTASKFGHTRPAHRPSHLLVRRSRRRRRRFRSHLCCCPDEDTASRSHWMTFSKRGG